MINFGYKKQFESILRALIAVGLGIVLFVFRIEAVEMIIRIIGIGILFAGMISIAPMLSKKEKGAKENKLGKIIGWTTCGIASVIGLFVVLKPMWFADLFIFILAAAIIVFCLIQLIALMSARSLIEIEPFTMILCAVPLVGAIVVMFFAPGRAICIVTGILLIIYGVSELLAMPKIHKAIIIEIDKYGAAKEAKESPKEPSGYLTSGIKDADYEEVRRR